MRIKADIANFWDKILNIGVTNRLSPIQIRKVRLINGILGVGQILFTLLVIKSFIMGIPQEWSVQLIGSVLFTVPVILNRLEKYRLAKLLCLLIPYLYLSFLSIYWGTERGSHLIILACIGLSVVYFEDRWKIVALIVFAAMCIMVVEIYNFSHQPYYITEKIHVAHLVNIIITITLLAVIAGIFKKENYKYQQEISLSKDKIIKQHTELMKLNIELKDSLKQLNEQNKYAQTIQESILPQKEDLERMLPEHFILFKPRDLVSGDFYFVMEAEGKLFIAAVDCTGHGVPGAFMSMIGYNMLLEAIELKHIYDPAEILSYLQARISYALRQQQTNNRDGMDISICVIDKQADTLLFAGAKNPMLIIQNDTLVKVEADRVSIGGVTGRENYQFKNYSFKASEVSKFYLFTDGYRDQYGGKDHKRFMSRRFRQMIVDIHHLPFQDQCHKLNHCFEQWSEGHEQTDDILVMGIDLSALNA